MERGRNCVCEPGGEWECVSGSELELEWSESELE